MWTDEHDTTYLSVSNNNNKVFIFPLLYFLQLIVSNFSYYITKIYMVYQKQIYIWYKYLTVGRGQFVT